MSHELKAIGAERLKNRLHLSAGVGDARIIRMCIFLPQNYGQGQSASPHTRSHLTMCGHSVCYRLLNKSAGFRWHNVSYRAANTIAVATTLLQSITGCYDNGAY